MENDNDDKILKKRMIKSGILFFGSLVLLVFLLISLSDGKTPFIVWPVMLGFLGFIAICMALSFKYRSQIQKPQTQKKLGQLLVVLGCLQGVLYLAAALLDRGLLNPGLGTQAISTGAFVIAGIIMLRKNSQ